MWGSVVTDAAIVYGTLRAGHFNARLWEGKADSHRGWLSGYRLYGVAGLGFPIVRQTGAMSDRVRIEVIRWRSQRDAIEGIRRLDWLEGVPTLYRRVEETVDLDDGSVATGWLYVPSSRSLVKGSYWIPSNDWDIAKSKSRT